MRTAVIKHNSDLPKIFGFFFGFIRAREKKYRFNRSGILMSSQLLVGRQMDY